MASSVPSGRPGVRVGSVVINGRDRPVMVGFWSAALGYSPVGADDDFVRMDDPAGRVNVSFQRGEQDPGSNWLHLDLYTEDQAVEVERLRGLGARVIREAQPGDDFVVMADPEGNRFCVIDATVG